MTAKKTGQRQPWLSEHCLRNKGAVKEFKEEWQVYRYLIGGKMFAMEGCDGDGCDIVTLKLKPEDGDFLRHQFSDIVPGYYMNKLHWNSVRRDGDVPDEVFKDMLDRSYAIVLASLPIKTQKAILEEEPETKPKKGAVPAAKNIAKPAPKKTDEAPSSKTAKKSPSQK
jgi:predicted DNA-binding protein (MmcQ/YjbR family)